MFLRKMKKINWKDQNITSLFGLPYTRDLNNLNRLDLNEKSKIDLANPNLIELGSHLSGVHLMFKSNSKSFTFDVVLTRHSVHPHMSNLAESGFDIYIYIANQWVFYQSIIPAPRNQSYQKTVSFKTSKEHIFMVYFPLYNQISNLDIYIDDNAFINSYHHKYDKKACIYGTSITQGACASRPGMTYTAILSRLLNHEIINYGFSGQGLGEDIVAKMMSEIKNIDYFIIDYEANAGAIGLIEKTLKPFIDILRTQYPKIPVMIVSRVISALSIWDKHIEENRLENKKYQLDFVQDSNDENIYFIDGEKLLPKPNDDMTVDGIHFNDLGFYHFSQNLAKRIQHILNERR
jgi:hypothetical protein